MHKITQEELLALARRSRLELDNYEIVFLMQQIDDVLSYAQRVKDVAQMKIDGSLVQKNHNVLREDIVIKTDPEPILVQAPESEEHYFVVPVIIETT